MTTGHGDHALGRCHWPGCLVRCAVDAVVCSEHEGRLPATLLQRLVASRRGNTPRSEKMAARRAAIAYAEKATAG